VIGLGLFLMLRPLVDPFALALPVTGLVNAAMALPFALRLTLPAVRQGVASHGRLADQLGLSGWAWARHALWPALRRPAGFAAGLAAALAAGDLGVIALFAPADAPTLPLLVHQLMGAYRMEEAAGAALLLLALALGLFALCDLWGRGGARHE
jgi:thiamine transport system permease protein